MPSYAIIGLPGGGKTNFAMQKIAEFLRTDTRHIVTNIPLNLDNLDAYMIKHFNDYTTRDRITLINALDYDSAKQFYLIRGHKRLASFPADFRQYLSSGKDDDEIRLDIQSEFGDGVIYVLDEVHQFLNARNWKAVGTDILSYLSLHRHFGDDVYWITQAPGNVDKQWRSLTQTYFECRNYALEKFRGFSKGNYFEVRETLNLPSPHNCEVAQSVNKRRLDRELSNCYHTSVIAGQADTGAKRKGLSYMWLIGAGAFVLLLVSSAIVFGGRFLVGKIFNPILPSDKMSHSDKMAQVQIPASENPPLPSPSPPPPASAAAPPLLIGSAGVAPLKAGTEYRRVKFLGTTALADGPYSWSDPLFGSLTVHVDGYTDIEATQHAGLYVGKRTADGIVEYVSPYQVIIRCWDGGTIQLLPERKDFAPKGAIQDLEGALDAITPVRSGSVDRHTTSGKP